MKLIKFNVDVVLDLAYICFLASEVLLKLVDNAVGNERLLRWIHCKRVYGEGRVWVVYRVKRRESVHSILYGCTLIDNCSSRFIEMTHWCRFAVLVAASRTVEFRPIFWKRWRDDARHLIVSLPDADIPLTPLRLTTQDEPKVATEWTQLLCDKVWNCNYCRWRVLEIPLV